jgi:hypothetical protein
VSCLAGASITFSFLSSGSGGRPGPWFTPMSLLYGIP